MLTRRPMPPLLLCIAVALLCACSGTEGPGNRLDVAPVDAFPPDAPRFGTADTVASDAQEVAQDTGELTDAVDDVGAEVSAPDVAPDVALDVVPDVETPPTDITPAEEVQPAADVPPETTCEPECDGKQCGPNGCGGTCGDCDPGKLCSQGACIDPGTCGANCEGKICGPDGCGGICGYCTYPEVCDPEGQCVEVCVPSCDGKFCGPDGCGGTCGVCEEPLLCGDDGLCYQPGCVPNCTGKVCGNDGCGGDCGLCAEPKICQNGTCQLGPCGTVTSVGECQGNVVVWCSEGVFLLEEDCGEIPDHACGYDGFANAYSCQPVGPCTPKCEDKACGSDSCGGWCSPGCPDGWSCLAGQCAPERGGSCGGDITNLGSCINNVLWFCSGGLLYSVDCNSLSQTCTWDNSQGKFGCL